ncbi:MAG: serine/threonine-protein kinase, partial [Planctomycetota bacterium]
MNAIVSTCPSASELKACASGKLGDSEIDRITQHLETCGGCAQQFDQSALDDQSLIRTSLTTDDTGDTPALDEEYESLAERLKRDLKDAVPQRGRLGEYDLLAPIGRGGMGVVYRARHRKLGKTVAVKLLPGWRPSDGLARARFEREMRAVGGLKHPAIVQATDAGEVDGIPYLVMELVPGIDLRQLLARVGPLPVSAACQIVSRAADALHHAHQQGLVHRDVKPSNLMLSPDGHVSLLDLSLARAVSGVPGGTSLTGEGSPVGTLDFLPPEQLRRECPPTVATDVFSLGATLYQLVTGRVVGPSDPQQRLSMLARVGRRAAGDEIDLSDIPDELVDVLSELLHDQPEQRPSSADEVCQLLSPFADGADLASLYAAAEPSLHRLPSPVDSSLGDTRPVTAEASPPRRGHIVRAGVAAGFLGLIAAITTLVLQTQQGSIVIESQAGAVQVELLKDGKVYRELTVEAGTDATKVWAGTYAIRVTGGSDLTITPNLVTVKKGATELATIRRQNSVENPSVSPPSATPDMLAVEPTDVEPTYDGKPFSEWLTILKRDRSAKTAVEAAQATLATATSQTIGQVIEAIRPRIESAPWERDLIQDPIIQTFNVAVTQQQSSSMARSVVNELPTISAGSEPSLQKWAASLADALMQRDDSKSLAEPLAERLGKPLEDVRSSSSDPWARFLSHRALHAIASVQGKLSDFDFVIQNEPSRANRILAAKLYTRMLPKSAHRTGIDQALIAGLKQVAQDPGASHDELIATGMLFRELALVTTLDEDQLADTAAEMLTLLGNRGNGDATSLMLSVLLDGGWNRPSIIKALRTEYKRRCDQLQTIDSATLRRGIDSSRHLGPQAKVGLPLHVAEVALQLTGRADPLQDSAPPANANVSGSRTKSYQFAHSPVWYGREMGSAALSSQFELSGPLWEVYAESYQRRPGRAAATRRVDAFDLDDTLEAWPILRAAMLDRAAEGDQAMRRRLLVAMASCHGRIAIQGRWNTRDPLGSSMGVSTEHLLTVPPACYDPFVEMLSAKDTVDRVLAINVISLADIEEPEEFQETLKEIAESADVHWLPAIRTVDLVHGSSHLATIDRRTLKEGQLQDVVFGLPTNSLPDDELGPLLYDLLRRPIENKHRVALGKHTDNRGATKGGVQIDGVYSSYLANYLTRYKRQAILDYEPLQKLIRESFDDPKRRVEDWMVPESFVPWEVMYAIVDFNEAVPPQTRLVDMLFRA